METLTKTDHIGNTREVEVSFDSQGNYFVASMRLGTPRRMASGEMLAPISALGTGDTAEEAARACIINFKERQTNAQHPAVDYAQWLTNL